MFLQKLEENEPKSINDIDKVLDFVDEYGSMNKLNVRQIRNVVASALSLAKSRAKMGGVDGKSLGDPRMMTAHLKEVLNITRDFQEQLESITMDRRKYNEAKGSRR
jgi:hypothetical protein